MTREEQWIKESIENYIFAYTGKRAKISDADAQHFTASVRSYLNLCTPSLPSNLDEAAEEFAWQNTWLEEPNTPAVNEHLCSTESFKAGAEWMAGQGITLELLIDYKSGALVGIDSVKTQETLKDYCNKIGASRVSVQIRKA